jgi:hypothetical protein
VLAVAKGGWLYSTFSCWDPVGFVVVMLTRVAPKLEKRGGEKVRGWWVVVVLARDRNGYRVLVLVVLGWFVRNAAVGLWVALVL